jgi:hypothetical protein
VLKAIPDSSVKNGHLNYEVCSMKYESTPKYIALPSLEAEENKKSSEYELSGLAHRLRFLKAISVKKPSDK